MQNFKSGDTVEGAVKNVTDFGAFIDLGGVDGLLHISEMSWGRIENPKKVFQVGETAGSPGQGYPRYQDCVKLESSRRRIHGHMRQRIMRLELIIQGRVARMTDFGAFVELAPGVDALLHVSQISRAHVEKPSDVLNVGSGDYRKDRRS